MANQLWIGSMIVGPVQTNCYILRNKEFGSEAVVIDPGGDAKKLIAEEKARAKTAAEQAAAAGRQKLEEESEKARKSAAEVIENAKLVGKASCTDIDRASEDAIARLRSAAERKLPDAARFIAERIEEDL